MALKHLEKSYMGIPVFLVPPLLRGG